MSEQIGTCFAKGKERWEGGKEGGRDGRGGGYLSSGGVVSLSRSLAKVGDLDLKVVRHQNVLRLEVSVDNAVLHRVRQLVEVPEQKTGYEQGAMQRERYGTVFNKYCTPPGTTWYLVHFHGMVMRTVWYTCMDRRR